MVKSLRRKLEGRLKSQGQLPFALLEPYLKLLAKFDETEAIALLEEPSEIPLKHHLKRLNKTYQDPS